MADDDLEVLVEEDPPADEAAAAPPEDETKGAKPVVSPEEGVEVLKGQLEAAKAESAANAARAQAAEQGAVQARTEVQQTNVQLVEGAISATKQALEALEGQIADAYATGDFSMLAKLQTQVARKAVEQLTLENGLEQLKNAPRPHPARATDPVEALASTLTPPAAAWVRAHPQFATDPRLNARLAPAHNLTESEGLIIDSPEYFARMEGLLGVTRAAPAAPAEDSALSETAVAAGGRSSSTPPPAAPARNGGNGSPRTIRLSREQVEAAAISGMTPQDYAKMLAKIEREKGETIQ